jgi:hypothetical protein
MSIPKELVQNHQSVILRVDGMVINGVPFLMTISHNWTAEWVPHKTTEAYRSVLDNVCRVYNQPGFCITTIHCDNKFRPLMDQ